MKKGRIFVMGDQHGSLLAVLEVLDLCKFDYTCDQLINLGDVVDGWSQSAELVQFWIEFTKKCTIKPIFIRGNHDSACQFFLQGGTAPDWWLPTGGAETVKSYNKTGYRKSKEHLDFFKKQVNYYIDSENRGFTHGGFSSKRGLGHEANQTEYYWNRDLLTISVHRHNAKIGKEEGIPSEVRTFKHKEIYLGHTPTSFWSKDEEGKYKDIRKGGVPVILPIHVGNVWNMDTAAAFHGKLSIMDIDTKELFQSKLVKLLYPNEYGRN